jgi:hypothetical protein
MSIIIKIATSFGRTLTHYEADIDGKLDCLSQRLRPNYLFARLR